MRYLTKETTVKRYGRSMLTILVTLGAATLAQAATAKLEVFPPNVNLSTSRDQQRVIAVATRPDGVTLDVTAKAQWKLANPSLAKIDKHALYPVADGETTLEISYEGHTVSIPVKVADAKVDRPISFTLDVMPVFMRTGCNTGSCHGAARGKDGFMLSLFGYDAAGDHMRLTHEIGFRRINLALPAESLLLEKIDGSVPHTGGKRVTKGDEYYTSMLRWLEAGAPNDVTTAAKVERLEVYPSQVVLEGEGATQQIIARAIYNDGTDRDVTGLASFMSNNDNSGAISVDGVITAGARGEAFCTSRFDTFTVGMQALILPKNVQYAPPASKPINYIDELVDAKLRKLRILPSDLCNDETFLRRVTIDITGLLPTEDEYRQFIADKDAKKRAKLVDELLSRKEFSEIWAMKWAEILLVKSNNNQVSYKSVYLYSNWLTSQISNNVPIDKMVQELIGSSGGTFKTPATNYYQTQPDLLKLAENTAQVFMGIRTQCAQCHNHPFDRWTMDDYYSFGAFFSQMARKPSQDYRETIVYNRGTGETSNPVTKKVMAPKFLGGPVPELKPGDDRRAALAKWLASPENPLFSTSIANRVWEHFFGLGIVQPVDDIRVTNPATNPELFAKLGEQLIKYNYDFKQLVRDICNSNTYQRTTLRNASNESDEKNFAHSNVRRIRAESLLDCISQVTESTEKYRGLPLGARAVQIADGATSNYFLTAFGRSARDTVCAGDVKTDPNLSQSLHLLNGPTLEGKIQRGAVIKKMLDGGKSPQEVVETLYVRCLSRKPTGEEVATVLQAVEMENDRLKALNDVFWAILNSREFIFNH